MERVTSTYENIDDEEDDEEDEQAKLRREGQSLAEKWAQLAAEHEDEEDEEDEDEKKERKARRAASIFKAIESEDDGDQEEPNGDKPRAFTQMFEQTAVDTETGSHDDLNIPKEQKQSEVEQLEEAVKQPAGKDSTDVIEEPELPTYFQQNEETPEEIEEASPIASDETKATEAEPPVETPPVEQEQEPEIEKEVPKEVGTEAADVEMEPVESESEPASVEASTDVIEDEDTSSTPPPGGSGGSRAKNAAVVSTTSGRPSGSPAGPIGGGSGSGLGGPGGPGGSRGGGDTYITNITENHEHIDARRRSGILPAVVSGVVVNKLSKNRDEKLQNQIDSGDKQREQLEKTQARAADEAEKQKQRSIEDQKRAAREIERQKVMDRDKSSKETSAREIQRSAEEERANAEKDKLRLEQQRLAAMRAAELQPAQKAFETKPKEGQNIEKNVPEWRARQLEAARERKIGLDELPEVPQLERKKANELKGEKKRDLKIEQLGKSERQGDEFVEDQKTQYVNTFDSNVDKSTTNSRQKQGEKPQQPTDYSLQAEKDLYKKSIAAGAITALVVVGAIIAIALLAR